jgi:hypothetical protein
MALPDAEVPKALKRSVQGDLEAFTRKAFVDLRGQEEQMVRAGWDLRGADARRRWRGRASSEALPASL